MSSRRGAPALSILALAVASLVGAAACDDPRSGADAASDGDLADVDADTDTAAAGDTAFDADTADASAVDAADAADTAPSGPRKVLFVGNSYTYYNDLPAVVAALGAATPGAAVEVESITDGGARLYDHWTTTGARERIAQGGLDDVVLQGQSVETFRGEGGFEAAAELFAGALRDAGARGVWYATWARRDDVVADVGVADADTMARLIDAAYRDAAEQNPGDVEARVGAAWRIAQKAHPEVAFHVADGSHPQPIGTLLAACVILRAISGREPVVPDPPPLDVPLALAREVCAIDPGPAPCDAGMDRCGGDRCVDVTWSPEHCGDCATVCDEGDPCVSGVCGCPEGRTGCWGVCVDLDENPLYCGTCDNRCSEGAACVDKECVCPAGAAIWVSLIRLSGQEPACETWDDVSLPACRRAADAICAALPCFSGGFGLPAGHAPPVEKVLCNGATPEETTYTALAAIVAGCAADAMEGAACATAVHRYCRAAGKVTGYGPIPGDGDAATVTCLGEAEVALVATTLTELGGYASRCFPTDPLLCSVAAWSYCEAQGYEGGFGPVEIDGDAATVACMPAR
ncbi:MAG: hypothetical protein H6745_14410 [Deltaproteobacteria bacterium]|nr:hypothetical protein [Deltaproteobacteria bacterium]